MKKVFNAIGRFFKAIYRGIRKLFINIVRFVVLVFRQMKKMRWPNKETIIGSTTVVLSFLVFMATYFIIGDFIIIKLLSLINY